MAQATRPFIGINTDFVPSGKQASAQARLHAGYFDAVVTSGGFPLLVPPLGKEVDLDALLDRLDGFVLCGGLDLDPKRQGQASHAAVQGGTPVALVTAESENALLVNGGPPSSQASSGLK